MNVLETYTRNTTPLIEGLSLNDDELIVPKLASTTYQNQVRKENNGTAINTYKIRQSANIPNFSLATSWNKYPIELHDILKGTGTYIIQIQYGSALYSGIFTYYDDKSADISDEIPLHAGGTFTRVDVTEGKEGRIFAKILTPAASGDTTYYPSLYLSSSLAEDNANSKISAIKFRKLI